MVFLKSRNILFLKTRKTAGTSIEVALSAFAGPGDILTPLAGAAERMRLAPPYRFAQNWARYPRIEADYRAFVERRRSRLARQVLNWRMERHRLFTNHMPAARLRQALGAEAFDRAFRIVSIRHPYEAIVSLAWMLHDPARPFARTVDRVLAHPRPRNIDIYCIDGVPVADFVLRYETLTDDLDRLEAVTGLDLRAHLPCTKHRARKDPNPARDQLTADQRARIRQRHAAEFALMDYTP